MNIGVAGAARQGKSTLLQRISGLNDTEIPTSDELPCTGAKSRIFHSEGQPHARIDFFREDEFLKEIVHEYFERLQLPKPSTLENFSRPLPPPNDQNSPNKNLYKAVYEELEKIHNAFPAFRQYLSKPPEIVDLKEIPEYVTQSNGRTKYLAVKTANVYTRFPQKDVTGLCLVDLPGLEAAQGHEKKLVDSLEHEVDAVILVKKPSPEGTQYDSDDFKVIDLIDAAAREVDLADWLFIILNLLSDRKNEKQVQLLKENPPTGRRFNILIGDCHDPDQAEKLVFSPVLTHLEQNLENIDRKFVKALSEKMRGIAERITDVMMKSREQLRPQQEDRRIQREYQRLSLDFIRGMKQKISDLVSEIHRSMPERSNEFLSKIEEICKLADGNNLIPPKEELEKRRKEEGGWPAAVQYELHHIRSALSKFLADKIDAYLSEQIHKALREVLDGIFRESVHTIIQPRPADSISPFETVKEIQKLFDSKLQPQLYDTFDYISKFNFSYHSHFHHRVRQQMSPLDTYDGTFVSRIIPSEPGRRPEDLAEDIEKGLDVTYRETIYEISKKFKEEMQADPANAIFSLVEEIGDRLVRQKDIDFEWQDFLYQVRSRMWPDVFSQFDQAAEFCRNWQSVADDMLKIVLQIKSEFGKMAG